MTREEQKNRREAMRAYKDEGHTSAEVAEKFSVHYRTARRICAGIAPQRRNQYMADTEKAKASRLKRVEKMVAENAPDFEYAGGYTDRCGTVAIRCKTCGHIEVRTWNTLRHNKIEGKKARCPVCYKAELEANRQKKREELKRLKEEKKKNRKTHKVAIQIEMRICKQCGSIFIPTHAGQLYCSGLCSLRRRNQSHKDKRIDKMVVIDKGIEIHKLAEMHNDVCALCGKAVDWNDYEWRNGAFVTGDWYPSIDHIVPLSKGGDHAWDNVQLAHRRCNYLKSDKPPAAEAV